MDKTENVFFGSLEFRTEKDKQTVQHNKGN